MAKKTSRQTVLDTTAEPLCTQSNHLVEASYRLDLVEKRVILCLLTKVDPRKPLPAKLYLDTAEYAALTGTNEKTAYRDLRNGALGLVGQVIRTSDVGRRMGRHQNWMDYVNYYDDEGRIEASFSPSIKPYISLLARRFTTMGIAHVEKFGSFYAIRLYELLLQFRETGWRRLALTELREILQIGPKQYPKFTEFRRRIIEPSVREINAKSDYRVTWAKETEGRNVVAVRFEFEQQAQLSLAI